MSRRRQQRRAEKARRHVQSAATPHRLIQLSSLAVPARVVPREASYVERLAYTRRQAAQALGISPSTLRRLLPYVDTIDMPWGGKLIPVDELERVAAERRRLARPRLELATRGRKPAVPTEVRTRICNERSAGKSLRQIADGLNADSIPTAHGGARWWASTIRAVLQRPGLG